MNASLTIALDVLTDARRNAFFLITVLISIGFVLITSWISLVENNFGGKIYIELGFCMLWFVHFLFATIYTAESLYSEDDRRSIYFYLSRCVSRQSYILGKFLGILLVSLLSLIFSGTTFFLCSIYLVGFKIQILYGLYFVFLEISVAIALMLLLSRLVSKFLSFFLFVFLIFFTNFLEFIKVSSDLGPLLKNLFIFMPNFQYYSFVQMVVHSKEISLEYVTFLSAYTIFICVILVLLSVLQYEHKNI